MNSLANEAIRLRKFSYDGEIVWEKKRNNGKA